MTQQKEPVVHTTSSTSTKLISGPFYRTRIERTAENTDSRHMLVPRACIRELFRQHLNLDVENICPLTEGMGAASFAIAVPNETNFFFKADVFGNHHIEHEALLLMRLRKYYPDFPAPNIFCLDLSRHIVPYACVIMEWCPGISLWRLIDKDDGTSWMGAFVEIGARLRQIHQLPNAVQGFGRLNERFFLSRPASAWPTTMFVGELESCSEYILRYLDVHLEYLVRAGILSVAESAQMYRVLHGFDYSALRPSNIHGDPSLKNFLFSNSVLTGVIDVNTRLAPVYEDLAYTDIFIGEGNVVFPHFDPTAMFAAFLSGYGEDSYSLDHNPLFHLFRLRLGIGKMSLRYRMKDFQCLKRVTTMVHASLRKLC